MDNPAFKDDVNIPLMHDDDDDHDIAYTSTEVEGETSLATPSQETLGSKVILLPNELKRQKIQALHNFMGIGGMLTWNETTGNTDFNKF